jgi:hypothetical protein
LLNFFALYLRKFAAFYLGCLSCFLLQTEARLSAVISSALVGLVATFIPFPKRFDGKSMQGAIYAGTFAGMCSQDILSGHPYILIISLIGALIYVLTKPHLNGFGGKLGAVAFVSSLVLLLIRVAS